jgi:hypothetical protein
MTKAVIIIFNIALIIYTGSNAQEKSQVYSTKFIPETVTFNGSDNPNECWESVACGITIKTGKNNSFFELDFSHTEKLKKLIGEAKVQIEVIYYNEIEVKTGAVGRVSKITFQNGVIYNEKE